MKLIRKNIARNSRPYELGHGVARLSVAANIRNVQIRLYDNESGNHRYILEMTHTEAQELADRIKSISISPENDSSQ